MFLLLQEVGVRSTKAVGANERVADALATFEEISVESENEDSSGVRPEQSC